MTKSKATSPAYWSTPISRWWLKPLKTCPLGFQIIPGKDKQVDKKSEFEATTEYSVAFWLVVYLPLWKMMEFVSWDNDIPNITEK